MSGGAASASYCAAQQRVEGGLWALRSDCMTDVWTGGERAGCRIAARFGRVREAVPPPALCLASCLDHACSLPNRSVHV